LGEAANEREQAFGLKGKIGLPKMGLIWMRLLPVKTNENPVFSAGGKKGGGPTTTTYGNESALKGSFIL